MAPAQPPELGAQGAEIELLPLGATDERGQLAAGGVVACSDGDREDPDLLLQPAPFGLERERPGVTVGQRPFQAGSVVDPRAVDGVPRILGNRLHVLVVGQNGRLSENDAAREHLPVEDGASPLGIAVVPR